MLPNLIFLDTETTGLGPDDRLIQLAFVQHDGPALATELNELFNPGRPIGFEAMAVHHVTEEMVHDKPAFKGSQAYEHLVARLQDHIVVAHNAPFDVGMLTREGIEKPKWIIDTRRVALHLLPDENRHALQYLRYALGLNSEIIEKHPEINAHDALSDVYVLEAVFGHLLKIAEGSDNVEKIKKMVELSAKPAILRKMSFGQHFGKTFDEVTKSDRGYLVWCLGKERMKPAQERNEDLLHTLKFHLNT